MPETEIRSSPGSKLWFKRGATLDYYQYIFLIPLGIKTISSDPYIAPTVFGNVKSFYSMVNVPYFITSLLNSSIVAGFATFFNLSLASFAAFAFARMNFKGRTGLYVFVLSCRLLPPAVVVIPYYIIMQALGLTNQLPSVIIMHTVITLPFSIWYLVLYYRTIPVEIEEASLIDGASLWQMLRHISFPIATSGLIAIGIFAFLFSYNEFMFAHFLIGKMSNYTIPVYMGYLQNPDMYTGMLFAMLTISLIPSIVLVVILWKFIDFSQLTGAVKA